jgi:tetratricopeptide (TPR) repeat protein
MESKKPLAANYFNLLVAFGLGTVWAFFWAVDTLLAYVLFGAASFFVVLFFYNLATSRQQGGEAFQPKETRRPFSTPLPPQAPASSGGDAAKKQKASQTIFILLVFVIGLLLFFNRIEDFIGSGSSGTAAESFTQGENFYNEAQYDSAYYSYRRALQEDPHHTDAMVGLGNTLYMRSQVDSALWYYEKAHEENPAHLQARYNIGWWYYDQKQFRKSISELKALIEQDSTQVGAVQLVGDNFYSLNEYDSAIRWYQGAYTNGARSRWLCHVMAYIYDTQNHIDQAIPLYKEAIQYDSTVVEVYVRLGELLPNQEGDVFRYKAAQLQTSQGN